MNDMRVWIGCLACYNGGKLVGEWFDLDDIEDVTSDDLHKAAGVNIAAGTHEELDVFDTDNLPDVFGEITHNVAIELGRALEDVPEDERETFAAYCASQWHGNIRHWSYSDFQDTFVGEFEDMEDYAYSLADDLLPSDASEFVRRYFDYEAFARDLQMDHVVIDLPNGNVAVFHH